LTRGSTFAGAAAIVDDVRVIPAMLKTL